LAVVKECNPISDERLYDAVNVLLSYQNESGGWATYENNRGYGWYEALNPSEVFGDIMIDYSYVECSSASITALRDFHQQFPNHRSAEIKQSLKRGAEFLMSIQRKDGSWYGSWACCFTYACWFGIEGLLACDYDVEHPSIKKAEAFLLSHQNENGGWGEDFSSCYDRSYSLNGAAVYGDEKSGVIQTAWALLALMAAESKDTKAVHKGIQYLMSRQLDSGDWAQEGITGVFNRACGITYTSYRNVFPIWALGKYTSHYAPNHM
jgi:squalene/oxidosqualene cyclase-like protein